MKCYVPGYLGNYNFANIALFARKRFIEVCNTIDLMGNARSHREKEEIALVAMLDLNDAELKRKIKMSRAKTIPLFNLDKIFGISGSGLIFLTLFALFLALPANSSIAATTTVSTKSLSKADTERARNYFTDTELTTHEGNKVQFYSDVLDGRIVMINVMYTNCKGSCPMLTQKLSQVSRELGDQFGKTIHFVSITNDAERDTPEALSDFARNQGVNLDGWTFLTGPKQQVDNVIKKIGLYTSRFEQHKAMILLGNTHTGQWQKVPPNLPYQAVAVKLKELAGGV